MTSAAKLIVTLGIIVAFFAFVLDRSPLVTVSPDSIRFMHFAEINADRVSASDGIVKGTVKFVFNTLRSSNAYDQFRGRFAQGAMYGVDALIRSHQESARVNLLMAILLTVNAGLIAWLASRAIISAEARINVFCLAWLALLTSCLVISPFVLLILYGKYLWITFVLAFFVMHRPTLKVCALALAAFSDEIGLFAAMIMTFLLVVRFTLGFRAEDAASQKSYARVVLGALSFGTVAAFMAFFAFYGISAVIFQVGATGFKMFALGGTHSALNRSSVLWDIVQGTAWRSELIVIGLPSGSEIIAAIVAISVTGLIVAACVKQFRTAFVSVDNQERLRRIVSALLEQTVLFYFFWLGVLVLIVWLVLPGRHGDLTHYSYPATAVMSLLLLKALVDLVSPTRAAIALGAVVLLHLALLPRAMDTTSAMLREYLFRDHSVTVADLRAIDRSVQELKATGESPTFAAINNGQEIDFSGTWFYSRVRGFDTATGPYFPVQGTVRVLAWPRRPAVKCVNRVFSHKGPYFTDVSCTAK